MRSLFMKAWQHRTLLITGLLLVAVVCAGIFFFGPSVESWWSTLRRESRRILSGEKEKTPPKEKQIREEVILKKINEVSTQQN